MLLIFITVKVTAQSEQLPNWEALMQLPGANYNAIVSEIDSVYNLIENQPSFNSDNNEGSYDEYVRWKHFWKNRVGRVGKLIAGFRDGVDPSLTNYRVSIRPTTSFHS